MQACAGGRACLTEKNGVYTPSHVTPAISTSEITLLVTLGPGIQSLEPGEFSGSVFYVCVFHGDYCMPLHSCEYLPDFNDEELWKHN